MSTPEAGHGNIDDGHSWPQTTGDIQGVAQGSKPDPKPGHPMWALESIELHKPKLILLAEQTRVSTCTVNDKGGVGKTPVATGLGITVAGATEQSTLLFDANQTKGSTASRVGVKKTATIRGSMAMYKKILEDGGDLTADILVQMLGRHPMEGYGSLRVIDSDNVAGQLQKVSEIECLEFLQACAHSFRFCIGDCGNTLTDSITMAAMRFADVPVFVARPIQENSLTGARDTMEYYRDSSLFPSKVARSVVAIIDQKPSLLRQRSPGVADFAKFFDHPEDQIVVIPYDPFYEVKRLDKIDDPDDLIKVVTMEQWQPKTLDAYLRLACLVYRQQLRANDESKS